MVDVEHSGPPGRSVYGVHLTIFMNHDECHLIFSCILVIRYLWKWSSRRIDLFYPNQSPLSKADAVPVRSPLHRQNDENRSQSGLQ